MFKKTLVTLLALCLVLAGAALAGVEEEVLTPEDIVYDAATYIEDVQYDLTEEPEEKMMMQNEFARRRFEAVRELAGKDSKQLREVLTALAGHERELGKLIDRVTNEDVVLLVAEASQMRGQNLLRMSQDEKLPEVARENMLRALSNQEKAMEKFRQAKERAGLNRGQGEDDDDEAGKAPVNPGTSKKPQGNR